MGIGQGSKLNLAVASGVGTAHLPERMHVPLVLIGACGYQSLVVFVLFSFTTFDLRSLTDYPFDIISDIFLLEPH